jgi:hypothetical protein
MYISDNFFELNDTISTWVQENKPFSLVRIDNTAGYVLDCISKGTLPVKQFFNENTLIEAGINPRSMDYVYSYVYPETIKAMKNSDILGFVDISGDISRNAEFLSQFPNKPIFYSGHTYHVLDPGLLVGEAEVGYVENPWTQYLKGKKVLVISSHYESIMSQWEKMDLVWGQKKDKIVPFDLVGCIRSPYHPILDDRQYPGCNTFEKLLDYTKKEIDKYDYDVLLTSVSHQSPFYADYAKQQGKIGIQTGGILQLYFGIKGNRWTQNIGYAKWQEMFNEHWIYPLEVDAPQRRKEFSFLETTFAYWG